MTADAAWASGGQGAPHPSDATAPRPGGSTAPPEVAGAPRSGPDDAGEETLDRLARVAWSALVEPGDRIAGTLVTALGAQRALAWVRHAARDAAAVRWGTLEERTGPLSGADRARITGAVARWRLRLPDVDPDAHLRALAAVGGDVVVRGDPGWPTVLDDLGAEAPHCLWVRGAVGLDAVLGRSVAVVGARAATTYGVRVADDLAGGLVDAGWTVVSGGAYGIDAAAHRAAVVRGGRTVVVLAGGVDRAYPAGNARLVEAVVGGGGAVVSEVPPGAPPSRSRFLQRNRLIAAAGRATVVVEAAWRSGAMSTAHHAARLLRPVGAVPGPVTSAASAGCHRLLRDALAVCVTDAAEVLELAGPAVGQWPVPDGSGRPGDDLDPVSYQVRDGLTRRPRSPVEIARAAGVTEAEARASLGLLELAGLARRSGDGWVVVRDHEVGRG